MLNTSLKLFNEDCVV